MNSKKTNLLVAILNAIAIISMYTLNFSLTYLLSSTLASGNIRTSIYDNLIIDFLLKNIQIMIYVICCGVGILNIICAVQNKKNKKIFFWQLVLGFCEIYTFIFTLFSQNDIYSLKKIGDKIVFIIVPIILAIINLILIHKNKPKVIQIISYILVIIASILYGFNIIDQYWSIIAIAMQFIYIFKQDKNINESNSRKIINIILYYILQVVLSGCFFIIVVYSIVATKVDDVIMENEISSLKSAITALQGASIKDVYIPVKENDKYGFIDENGKEKIKCEYDKVTFFSKVEIDASMYYIAFTEKDNDYYIITKSNNTIKFDKNLKKYMEHIYNFFEQSRSNKENNNYYIQLFEFYFQCLTNLELDNQTFDIYDNESSVTLTKKDSTYYYQGKNYSMKIEPIYDNKNSSNDYSNNESYTTDDYSDNEGYSADYYINSNEAKYNVTITKANGKQESNIFYLEIIEDYDGNLIAKAFSNDYIKFKDENETVNGFIDENGNINMISNNYLIEDVKDNKIILYVISTDEESDDSDEVKQTFIIINMSGNVLLKTTAIDIYENMYLVKNDNNKIVLIDKNLKPISNEYDKIITNRKIDVSSNFSSDN